MILIPRGVRNGKPVVLSWIQVRVSITIRLSLALLVQISLFYAFRIPNHLYVSVAQSRLS